NPCLIRVRMSPARFVERTLKRGLVRDRGRADRANADVGRDAVGRKSEAAERLVVSSWHESVKGSCRVGRCARTPPQPGGERVVSRTDDRYDEGLGKRSRHRVGVACRELTPLAVLADEAAK